MNMIDTSAANIVSGYETAAKGENEALVGYWLVGTEYRFVVDNGLSVDSLIAAVKVKDGKGFASRRGGHSKSNLSKAGKLAKTYESYEAMIVDLDEHNLAHSFEVAYTRAVEKAESGRKVTPPTPEVKAQRGVHSALKPLSKAQQIKVLKAELKALGVAV